MLVYYTTVVFSMHSAYIITCINNLPLNIARFIQHVHIAWRPGARAYVHDAQHACDDVEDVGVSCCTLLYYIYIYIYIYMFSCCTLLYYVAYSATSLITHDSMHVIDNKLEGVNMK